MLENHRTKDKDVVKILSEAGGRNIIHSDLSPVLTCAESLQKEQEKK